MKTIRFYNVAIAALAMTFMVSASYEAMAQSSTRKNTSGTPAQKAAPSTQKMTAAPSSRSASQSPDKKHSTSSGQKNNSSDRNATQSRKDNSGVNKGRNYSDHMGNVRTQSGINTRDNKNNNKDNNRPNNNGNVTNRPDNKPNNNGNVTNRPDNNRPNNNGNVTNRPDNKPNNNRPEVRPDNDRKPNVTNRPGTEGPRPTYYAGRGGNSATKLPPAPKFDRSNPNRHLGYNPFRDGRIIHRPAIIHIDYDLGMRFLTRPRIYHKYRINGMSMYFWNGVWYWHAYGYYNVHRPPVGTRIPISDISPYLYEVDYDFHSGIHTRTYYVDSYANFYVQVNSWELEVVNAPDGAVLYDMPSDYKEIIYDGSIYYVVGNSIFEYVYSNANSWYFRAVGIYR